jgi:hypothetical protein
MGQFVVAIWEEQRRQQTHRKVVLLTWVALTKVVTTEMQVRKGGTLLEVE